MKIVSDSSCDFNDNLRKENFITKVPLTLYFQDKEYKDDDTLNVKELLDKITKSKDLAKSACPSPDDFLNSYKGDESVFCVTMTSALSSTYNSAVLAKEMYLSDIKEKFIHIFDSKGSSVKETLICIKIKELIDLKFDEKQIVDAVNDYIENMKFFFQLGSLDTLIKNGRISKYKGIIANALNIKPILYGNELGEIELLENVRTEKKAKNRLVELVGELSNDIEGRILGISHCNALDKANWLKSEIVKKYNFKDVIIVEAGGLSGIYMNEGGITISF